MTSRNELGSLADDELLNRLSNLLQQSRRVESELVAHIGEVDARRLYAREGCPSMFSYCTDVLHLSEAEAYLRIAAARGSRVHPVLLEMLGDGRLHLSGMVKVAPKLTAENRDELLARAAHKTKRQIEELLVEIEPRPDVPPRMRKLPDRKPHQEPRTEGHRTPELRPDGVPPDSAPPPPAPPKTHRKQSVEPLSPKRYKVEFTASAELRDKDTTPSNRHIPAPVRRAVCKRDGNRCTFVDSQGKRCKERNRLEFHHHKPFGRGGDHSLENLRLMCRAHNAYFAERDYGKDVMERYRGRAREPAPIYGVRGTSLSSCTNRRCSTVGLTLSSARL